MNILQVEDYKNFMLAYFDLSILLCTPAKEVFSFYLFPHPGLFSSILITWEYNTNTEPQEWEEGQKARHITV